MKFAHEFKDVLEKEGFPQQWLESAIPYSQLKKCLKKVEAELQSLGLDPHTLAQFMAQSKQAGANQASAGNVAFQYDFDGDRRLFPKLTVFVQLQDGIAVDAALTPETRNFLVALALKQQGIQAEYLSGCQEIVESPDSNDTPALSISANSKQRADIQRVEVPLTFDTEFFELLQEDVANLDNIQVKEQQALGDEIAELSKDMQTLARPSKFHKTDMYRWRELFDIYLQAGIFFSTHELDHGSRDSTVAARQLQWFQSEVMRRGLVGLFKLPASHQALNRFIAINVTLLKNLKFQEINKKAIAKILKKFDKRTQLGAGRTFPKLIQSDAIMSETLAKSVCAQVSQDLVKTTPQLDEFLCPICFAIVWRPIRLRCQHLLCIRCTVLLQRQKKKFCPLCREDVVLAADEDNIDNELVKFLRKYFPKEVKEKQIAHEKADGEERFGIYYKHPSEEKCSLM